MTYDNDCVLPPANTPSIFQRVVEINSGNNLSDPNVTIIKTKNKTLYIRSIE